MKNAYYQFPIEESEEFTAFEADGRLYQSCRIPFDVTNGVSYLPRTVDEIITNEKLSVTIAYIDNLTIAGIDVKEHERNLSKFLDVGISFNETKSVTSLKLGGYEVSFGCLKPHPDRLEPL